MDDIWSVVNVGVLIAIIFAFEFDDMMKMFHRNLLYIQQEKTKLE